ncbi:MAG: alkyl hydroperoxide reductase [Clostridia bacterium BRH_c25]|nr:MAG: alkyl hydroperoxide reductase [Clostridia bacterium BRH_c25]
MLKQGDAAADFLLKDGYGKNVSLSEFKGKKVVLFFYPRDNTPGCTKEACSFRDVYDLILAEGAVVLGISADNEASHQKFRERYGLPFYLLSDIEHKVSEAYGTWGEKKIYGNTYIGMIRSTFIIDEQGMIMKVFPKVKPENHGGEVLNVLREGMVIGG